jgi:hypothetical protein
LSGAFVVGKSAAWAKLASPAAAMAIPSLFIAAPPVNLFPRRPNAAAQRTSVDTGHAGVADQPKWKQPVQVLSELHVTLSYHHYIGPYISSGCVTRIAVSLLVL